MKKLLLLFTLTLIVCLFPLQSFAYNGKLLSEEGTVRFEDVVYLNQLFEGSVFAENYDLQNRYEGAMLTLKNGAKNFENIIDISEYDIPVELGGALFTELFLYNPELFFLNNSYSYYYYEDSPDYIALVELEFVYTPSEYAVRKRQFDSEVEKITSLITTDMSELEKALIVHDYIDLHCEYDTEPLNTDIEGNKTYRDSSFRADGIIVNKVGVCQSYSMAYYYIMSLLGVETDYVQSNKMNHMWNIFKIGDNWYHVDSTWDDPVPDGYAYVSHQHFLASDDLISSGTNPHDDWIAKHDCTDSSLDDHFWRYIKGAIASDGNGNVYYHSEYEDKNDYNFEILSHNLVTHETEIIKTIRESWPKWDDPSYRYLNVYSDVSFYNGKLYYNTPTEIMEMNTDGEDEKIIVRYQKEDGYIYGSMLDEYVLVYGVAQEPKAECKEFYVSLENKIGVKPTDIQVSVLRKYLDYDNMPGKIIATLYDEDDIVKETKILTLSECNLTDPYATVPVNFQNETGKYIKLMWWNLETISPIANNIKYPIQ